MPSMESAANKAMTIYELESKITAFKSYVHARLDEAGIPEDHESPHRAEGCRIGGRLDYVFNEINRLKSQLSTAGITIVELSNQCVDTAAAKDAEITQLREENINLRQAGITWMERLERRTSERDSKDARIKELEEKCQWHNYMNDDQLVARIAKLEADNARIREMLEAHHRWHLDQTERTPVYFGDTIGQVDAEEYAESELCLKTSEALKHE